jgi:hypothetical protein
MWRITLIVECDDRDAVDRIAEQVSLAACPVRFGDLTYEHECEVPWMMITSPLDEDEAHEWRDDLNR